MKNSFASFLVVLLLVIFGASASSAITIGFEPASQTVDLGTQVNAALVISGLGNGTAPSLGTFDVTVVFDPSILAYSSVTYGDPVLGDQLDVLSSGFPMTITTPSAGAVELFELSLNAVDDLNNYQAPNFILATLTFDTLGLGTSPLDITICMFGDASGDEIMPGTVENGSVGVGANRVPEPSVLFLLASGLAALGWSGRKRTSAGQEV